VGEGGVFAHAFAFVSLWGVQPGASWIFVERLLTLCPFWISRSPSFLTAQLRGKGSLSLPDTSHIHFPVPLLRYKIPHLFQWSHDSVCLSTFPFPGGSSGLPWGWGSWWQIWRIWSNVTMAEPESGEGAHELFEALVVAASCLFFVELFIFCTYERALHITN